ncbi:MAG: ribulose-phosphate 3-epimerase [candidate division KSB1 bacterium]|nr:ribulose-phosphate 3-epimerase [candidate division KSB1 bacterium]MDQ7064987.1 ribulose-phosphate 3-epimerase [candidate division KSB1 bacterium]
MPEIIIAPSILSADFRRLEEQVEAVVAGGANWIHCDVMDGHFVPNISFGPMIVAAVRKVTELPLDTHLMISRPEQYVQPFRDAGADRLIVHAEATVHLHRLVDQIKRAGMLAGVAINPATPLQAVEEILPDVDLVLIMTVNPGFGGQAFIANMLDKVRRLKRLCETRQAFPHIEVDGGIDETTAIGAVKAGANVLVAGSSIFSQSDPAQAVRRLRKAAESAAALVV